MCKQAMARLQQSFDSSTRLTLAINKVAVQLIGAGASVKSEAGRELANRARALCKELAAPSKEIEDMLFAESQKVKVEDVKRVLKQVYITIVFN